MPIRLAGFQWKAGASKHIVYLGEDNHVHELSFTQKSKDWHHTDVTINAGAPSMPDKTGIFAGYECSALGSKQIIFTVPADHISDPQLPASHIMELSRAADPNADWGLADLTSKGMAPAADAMGTNDGHIHELVYEGGQWSPHDLMKEHPAFPRAAT